MMAGVEHRIVVRILAMGDEADVMREAARVLPQERPWTVSDLSVKEFGEAWEGGKTYALLTFRILDFWKSFEDDTINVFAPCEFEAFHDGFALVDGTTWEFEYGASSGLLLCAGEHNKARLRSADEILEGLDARSEEQAWAERPQGKPDVEHMVYHRGQFHGLGKILRGVA